MNLEAPDHGRAAGETGGHRRGAARHVGRIQNPEALAVHRIVSGGGHRISVPRLSVTVSAVLPVHATTTTTRFPAVIDDVNDFAIVVPPVLLEAVAP